MRMTCYLTIGLALVLGLPAARAPGDDKEKKAPEKKTDGPAPFTDKSLKEAIEKLGYEPTVFGEKKNIYQLIIKSDTFNSVFNVSLSDDGKVLWFDSKSRPLIDLQAIPEGAYLKLLSWNDFILPAHFTLDEKEKRIFFQMSLPNIGMTNEALNAWIDHMATNIKRTWPDWKYDVIQPYKPVVDSEAAAKARKGLLGTWTVHSVEQKGKTTGADSFKGYTYTFEGTRVRHGSAEKRTAGVALDPAKDPPHFDFRTDLSKTEQGIYKLDGDTLTICVDGSGKTRPAKFEAPKDSANYILTLKREKKP